MQSIRDNYLRIKDEVREASIRSGRTENDVTLVAVTKYVDTARIYEAVCAGAENIGENRVQELCDKLDFFNLNKLSINLIGQLQNNKVKYVIGKVSLIQSVDRESLAMEINRRAGALNTVQDVLVEINIGGEEQKGGIMKDEALDLIYKIAALPFVRIKGLMCVPPAVGEAQAQRYFADTKRLFDSIASKHIENVSMECLSMGMSGDFKAAIAQGSTMVRVGSAIFGQRNYAAHG